MGNGVDMERIAIRRCNSSLERLMDLRVRYFYRDEAQPPGDAPDVGVHGQNLSPKGVHEDALCRLCADARQGREVGLGLGVWHAA
jgi:hypothetical protein